MEDTHAVYEPGWLGIFKRREDVFFSQGYYAVNDVSLYECSTRRQTLCSHARLSGPRTFIVKPVSSNQTAVRSSRLSACSVLSGPGSVVSAGAPPDLGHSTQLGHMEPQRQLPLSFGVAPHYSPPDSCSTTLVLEPPTFHQAWLCSTAASLGAVISAWNHLRSLCSHRSLGPSQAS